jgi:hypothetical protein
VNVDRVATLTFLEHTQQLGKFACATHCFEQAHACRVAQVALDWRSLHLEQCARSAGNPGHAPQPHTALNLRQQHHTSQARATPFQFQLKHANVPALSKPGQHHNRILHLSSVARSCIRPIHPSIFASAASTVAGGCQRTHQKPTVLNQQYTLPQVCPRPRGRHPQVHTAQLLSAALRTCWCT